MKFATAFSVLALAAGEERKVPPRTPPQRLNTLQRFAGNWIDAQISREINRPNRATRMTTIGIARLFNKMTEAYAKPCAFFDPNVPHGGPNPNSTRKRRSAWVQNELSRIAREVADNDSIDIFDQMEAAYERGDGERSFGERALSSDVNLAWKQIGTGFRKWILRYISDCRGQKEFSYHTNRLAKIHGNIKTAYDTVGASQEEDYEGEDYE
jgi:hypothetical protein